MENNTNEIKINETLPTTQDVTELDQNTTYVARIEFMSVGDSAEVRPNFFYSHNFPDDYEGEFPSAFLALRDMTMMLKMMLNDPESGMTEITQEATDDQPAITALDEIEASRATKN